MIVERAAILCQARPRRRSPSDASQRVRRAPRDRVEGRACLCADESVRGRFADADLGMHLPRCGRAQGRSRRACRESAFEAVRAQMKQRIDKFNRYVFEQVDASPAERHARCRSHWARMVPREIAFGSAGRTLKGYFYAPPGEGPFPCMVCNHGSTIEKGTLDVARPRGGGVAGVVGHRIVSAAPHRGYGNSPGPAWREDVPAEAGPRSMTISCSSGSTARATM